MKTTKLIIILCTLIFLHSCREDVETDSKATADTYFPDKVFSGGKESHKFVWYTEQLRALKEPSLYAQRSDVEKKIFRFTWLRTFHNPISIRLEIEENGTGVLYVKMTSGAGGYEPGEIKENYVKQIEKVKVDKFLEMIKKLRFWGLPCRDEDVGVDVIDGAQWIIEGLWNGKYHLVDKWSPEQGPVREIGMYFLGLSELKVEEIY